MVDEEGPWWTRPPSPSSHPAAPASGEAAASAPPGQPVARQPPPPPAAPLPLPPPLGVGTWEPAVIDLRDDAAPPGRESLRTWDPQQSRSREGASHGLAPASAAVTEQLPPVPAVDPVPAAGPAPAVGPAPTRRPDPAPTRRPGPAPSRRPDPAPGRTGDALGVYGTPSRVAPGIPGLSTDADPLAHLRPPERPRYPMPDRRMLSILGGVLAVLVVVVLVRWAAAGTGEPAAGGEARKGSDAAPAAAVPGQPKDLRRVSEGDAAKDLRRAGQSGGDVVGAWGWSDNNGRNLLATVRQREGGDDVTLRVVHLGNLAGDPKELRVMKDPGLPGCNGEGTTGFTKNSVQVRDLNRDGVAEVTVGWVARCGGSGAESRVKLALLSDGDKYILRGTGIPGSGKGTRAPEPAASRWPDPYLKTLTAMYKDLYF